MSGFYDDASWVLIPEGIKEDVVYAQKPTDGLGDLTFTRASDATRTNSAGVIERTPWNLLQSSEMFTDASWAKTQSTITANTITAPNGTLTADTIVATTSTGQHDVNFLFQPFSGISYTLSCYFKKGTTRYVYINSATGTGVSGLVVFDFDNETFTQQTNYVGSFSNVGNGWYRVSATLTSSTSSSVRFRFGITLSATSESSSLTTSDNAFIWGAQIVEGTDAKPYFATTNRQDVPRLDYRNADGSLNSCPRLLLEPQRTNSIRNSTMVGAVAGSPGTLPTNWANVNAGLTRTVVGVGTENGLPYVDVRFNGTASATNLSLRFEGNTQVAASNGQTWTNATYIKRVAGDVLTGVLGFSLRDSGGGSIANVTSNITLSQTLQRFSVTQTISAPTTAFIIPLFDFNVNIGQTYDFTIRIAAPQMELGAYATTFIPTTTAAVTRIADVASKTGISSLIGSVAGTAFIDTEFSDTPSSSVNNDILALLNASNVSLGVYSLFIEGSTGNLRIFFLPGNTAITMKSGNNRNQRLKIAFAYANADFVCYVNGTQVYSSTTRPLATGLSAINLHESPRSGLDGINQAALFTRRLTNAELAEITT
jgi:hypothetical protein